jgi:hypothetical protein
MNRDYSSGFRVKPLKVLTVKSSRVSGKKALVDVVRPLAPSSREAFRPPVFQEAGASTSLPFIAQRKCFLLCTLGVVMKWIEPTIGEKSVYLHPRLSSPDKLLEHPFGRLRTGLV